MSDLRIVIVGGPAAGRRFEFRDQARIGVGRSFEADVSLAEDGEVSRVHCEILRLTDGWQVNDLSKFGTAVNGRPIQGPRRLNDGDLLFLGASRLEVHILPSGVTGLPADGQLACVRDGRPAPPRFLESDPDGWTGAGYVCPPCRKLLRKGEQPFALYELLGLIAETASSRVFAASDRARPGRRVAIKVLQPDLRADPATRKRRVLRFLLEAEHLKRLDHPGIVRLYDLGEDKGRLYMVLESMPGGTLRDLVQREAAPLSLLCAGRIIVQVLSALAYAHERTIIHRDLKPENILLDGVEPDPGAKIADFGLAKCLEATGDPGLTTSGEVGGTFEFMAPEQYADFKRVGPPADVYSAALTFQYLFAGARATREPAPRPPGLAPEGLRAPLPLAALRPDLPSRVLGIMEAAKNPDPAQRPTAAAFQAPFLDVLGDLDAVLNETAPLPPL
ncbi:MAG: protein kinase [Planctomycetes bacterium]|nr:protein kinase [Planctomycetota bacterium]